MSIAAAFIMIAQSAAPAVSDAPAARPVPVAQRVTARATIQRPATIRFEVETQSARVTSDANTVQRGRDAAGTVWIEFS